MPRLRKRIRETASVPNQSCLDSEGFVRTKTSLEFFFAFIYKKEQKIQWLRKLPDVDSPFCFLQMFPFCGKSDQQTQEPLKNYLFRK